MFEAEEKKYFKSIRNGGFFLYESMMPSGPMNCMMAHKKEFLVFLLRKIFYAIPCCLDNALLVVTWWSYLQW